VRLRLWLQDQRPLSKSSSAAASAAVLADPSEAEVARIRLTHLRHVHTESLILRMLGGGQTTLRQRATVHSEEMKSGAKRAEPLLDVNYQDDEGKTLLRHVRRYAKLQIDICARGEQYSQLITA
jgi:hypothetical protein